MTSEAANSTMSAVRGRVAQKLPIIDIQVTWKDESFGNFSMHLLYELWYVYMKSHITIYFPKEVRMLGKIYSENFRFKETGVKKNYLQ